MNKLAGFSAAAVVAACLASVPAQAGTQCRKFGTNGWVNNWHGIIDQSDATLKSIVGLGGNLCGPAAATHVLAGYDDFPLMPSDSDAAYAGFGGVDVSHYGWIIRKFGMAMGTNRTLLDIDLVLTDLQVKQKGTMAWDVSGPVGTSLWKAFYSFGDDLNGGAVPTTSWSTYSGLFPVNFTTDTLAERVCAAAVINGKANPGGAEYDYAKAQGIMSYGYFSISQLEVPYPCGDWYLLGLNKWCLGGTGLYSVMMTGGHFVSVVGGYDDGTSRHIAIANPHNSLYWSNVNQITVKIAGLVTLFDRAGTVYDPGASHANQTKIVSSYTATEVRHGMTCPAGTSLDMPGNALRGNCLIPIR